MITHELKRKFIALFGESDLPLLEYFSPGRINLIGEHIDYNGGFVFPAALTLGITAVVRRRSDKQIIMNSLNAEGQVVISTNAPVVYDEKDGWGNYPKGVLQLLINRGMNIGGCEILFSSTLPDGAGLSSSAAIETLTYYIICSLASTEIDAVQMAKDCRQVENNFIKVNCGIMDQFTVAMGRANRAILLDCATIEYQYVPLTLGDYSLVIMNTNKRRELADSKYNERRTECDAALDCIRKRDGSIANLCQATPDLALKSIIDPVLRKRALHAISENARVLDAVEALKANNLAHFGDLLNASHQSLKDYYQVTGVELDTIVEEALNRGECIGARMTGAGFGGCAIALVRTVALDEFVSVVGANYLQRTGLKADFYISTIGDGTRFVS
ncbi:MAG: galactokinase [Negativicutes bacterium]|jgi:galactokinase